LTEASLAIDNALTKLMLAIPHGRDYYVQGDSALKLAMDQHRARVQKLIDVREENQGYRSYVADLTFCRKRAMMWS
jgi:hypothetical protein